MSIHFPTNLETEPRDPTGGLLVRYVEDVCQPVEELHQSDEGKALVSAVKKGFRIYQNYQGEILSDQSAGQEKLLDGYGRKTSELDLQDCLVLMPGRQKPGNLGDFTLRSITGWANEWNKQEGTYGQSIDAPYGLTCDYNRRNLRSRGSFFADTPAIISLVYGTSIVAVAGAIAFDEETARIVQLQGTIKKDLPKEDRMKSGLHNGFKWRETLVNAWASVAQAVDFSAIELQGGANNYWADPFNREALRRGYDEVAECMGMTLTPEGNWRRDFEPPAQDAA